MTFDRSVPVHEQLQRIVKCHTGRKHKHLPSTRKRNAEAAGARKALKRIRFEASHPTWVRA